MTTSKDGTMKIWKVDVKFEIGEDPKCLKTITCPVEKKPFNLVAISSDMKTIATTIESNLHFYSMGGTPTEKIESVHVCMLIY